MALALADLRGDPAGLLVDDALHRPVLAAPRGREEPAQHLHAVLGVQHLGMELHAVEPPARGLHRRYRRRRGARGDGEARRRHRAGVAVRHPDLLARGQAGQQRPARRVAAPGPAAAAPRRQQFEPGRAILTRAGVRHRSAQPGHHQLEAVADPEHRHPGVQQAGRRGRRALGVDRGRAAGQDDRGGPAGQDLARGHRGRHDLRVHVALADPPGDQLCVLRAEVHHQHGVEIFSVHHVAFPGSCAPALRGGTTCSLGGALAGRRAGGLLARRRAGGLLARRVHRHPPGPPGPPGPARCAGRPARSR